MAIENEKLKDFLDKNSLLRDVLTLGAQNNLENVLMAFQGANVATLRAISQQLPNLRLPHIASHPDNADLAKLVEDKTDEEVLQLRKIISAIGRMVHEVKLEESLLGPSFTEIQLTLALIETVKTTQQQEMQKKPVRVTDIDEDRTQILR